MDLYKLPLHKTHVINTRMAAWTASRSLEGKYVVFGGGGHSGGRCAIWRAAALSLK